MRALAVCQDELTIRTLHQVLSGTFDIEFLVESRPLARRLVDDQIAASVGDPKRVDSYLRADLSPSTCVIVEDNGKRSLKRVVTAIRDAGGSLLYVLHAGTSPSARKNRDELKARFLATAQAPNRHLTITLSEQIITHQLTNLCRRNR